jgi:hypothetical protein
LLLPLSSSQRRQEEVQDFHANTLNLPPQNYASYI